MRYAHILAEVLSMPWAVHPHHLAQLAEILAFRAAGHRLTETEIEARIGAGQDRAVARGGGGRVGAVAVLPILGLMLPRADAMETSGTVSIQQLGDAFQALVNDETVGAVVLDMDSPGGSVGGVAEFADQVFAARARKPVVALASPMMCSAAYWIGAAASELVVTPSSLVGSIGVYSAHQDVSEALAKEGVKVSLISAGDKKTLGSPFEPLSDEARAEFQARVDTFYGLFVKAVARGRGVSQKAVREGFGQGGVVNAAEAVDLGMADRVGTLDDVVASLAGGRKTSGPRALSDAEIAAAAPPDVLPGLGRAASDLRTRRLRLAEARG